MQKTNQIEFRVQKVIKGKGDKLYINWKSCDNSFSSLINKKKTKNITLMKEYFRQRYEISSENIKVELDLYNYPRKADFLKQQQVLIHLF